VRMKFDDQSDWRKAEIANVLPHRSYELRLEDGTVRRRTHAPLKNACPAFGQTCTRCLKKNHFAVICRSAPANASTADTCDLLTEDLLLMLQSTSDKRWFSHLLVNGQKVRFLVDTGSTADVLPISVLASLGKPVSDLRPPRSILRMFDRSELHTVAMLTAQLTHPHNKTEFATDLYVMDKAEPVLNVDACRRLDIVHIDGESVSVVSETNGPESPRTRPTPAPRLHLSQPSHVLQPAPCMSNMHQARMSTG